MALISEKMNAAMNAQIVEELASGYIYLGISIWADERSMHTYAAWMRLQAKEENEHAEKFMRYIVETGGHVTLGALPAVKTEYANTEETIKVTIAHEEHITKKIRAMFELAMELKEYEAYGLLQWYIKEQIEEEANSKGLMDLYELNGKRDGLFDHHVKRE